MLIQSEIEMISGSPPWDDGNWHGHAYEVVLRFQGRQMTVPFWTGDAHPWPTTLDVVECLASDFFCFDKDYNRSFEEFCSDMGYDSDSRKALTQYKAGVAQTKRFKVFIGRNLLGWLMAEGDAEAFAKRYSATEEE